MNAWKWVLFSVGVSLGLSSCANPYDRYPEGTVADSAPVGYNTTMVGGITYWYSSGHYYRHWPRYGWVVVRPPHNRPPHTKPPKPEHPIERPKPKPEQPIAKPKPGQPAQRPSDRPSTQPVQRPTTRPTQRPSTRPPMQTRPSMPARPTARPASGGLRR